ncbi:MAG: response regulator [Bacillota bacterium]|nr:response regulator [Bacillota bacterium]
MSKLQYAKKYIAPILCAVTLVIILVIGIVWIRSYMAQQAVQERSSQLEEVSSQIKANLGYGLEFHWNLVSGIEHSIAEAYSDDNALIKEIKTLEEDYCTEKYGCRLMFIDTQGNTFLDDGTAGIWDDINRFADGKDRHTFVSETSNIDGAYIAFVQKIKEPIVIESTKVTITHVVLLKDIRSLKKYYTTESYGGNAATYIIKDNGTLAFYDSEDNIMGVRNIFKALKEAEHIQGRSFDVIKQQLKSNEIAAANIILNGTEYYYCLTALPEYDMTLMLLIPAEYVAVSTMNMMSSSFKALILFAFIMMLAIVMLIISIITIQRRNEIVKYEQENNRELHKLKLAAEDALGMAEAANKSKSTFLSNMSHDIRTPMNAIIGFATLAMTNVGNTEKVRDYLSKILSSSNHLLSLINDILDMSRIESGKINLEEAEANLSDMLHDIKTIIGGQLHAKQLELFMDVIDVTDEDVYCDKTRLNQVLLNLLSNAIKFTPAGGLISVRVAQIHNAPEGKGLYEIRVKDTGIGMSQEFVEKIFEPFERESTSTVSKIQGTGLGMAISKNIIDMMGGTIEVVTEQGKGTEFIVRLTLRLQEERRSLTQIKELEGLKALVVDDDFNTCDSVTKMLVKVGMRSEWTLSGKEAVLRARQSLEMNDGFHAYIIDWRLPDMNGIEVTRQIRSLGDDTPIIILTAYDWDDIEAEARAAGVTAFCSKPMFLSDLRDALLTSLGQQPARKEYNLLNVDDANGFEGKHLLLVEDNELNREIAVEILSEHGFHMDIAVNGAEAVEILLKSEPGDYDAVLMDIQMPVMDGYEATKRIRAFDDMQMASIPIIAMTANAFNEDRKAAQECGMDGFMSKPIDMDEVVKVLQDVFGRR